MGKPVVRIFLSEKMAETVHIVTDCAPGVCYTVFLIEDGQDSMTLYRRKGVVI